MSGGGGGGGCGGNVEVRYTHTPDKKIFLHLIRINTKHCLFLLSRCLIIILTFIILTMDFHIFNTSRFGDVIRPDLNKLNDKTHLDKEECLLTVLTSSHLLFFFLF